MHRLLAIAATVITLTSYVSADVIPEGDGAHFFSLQSNVVHLASAPPLNAHHIDFADTSLVFGPQFDDEFGSVITLAMQLPGDGSTLDQTIIFPNFGQGMPGPLVTNDLCISSAGVEVGSATDALRFVDCVEPLTDPAQTWTVQDGPHPYISNGEGNCITLFPENAVIGGPVCVRLPSFILMANFDV